MRQPQPEDADLFRRHATDLEGKKTPHRSCYTGGAKAQEIFSFRKCGLPVPYVSWCKKEPYSAGDVVVEQVSAHFGRFAVA
jgi:hypothetical protein